MRFLGCLLAAVMALQFVACRGENSSLSELPQAGAPKLAPERVPGTYVGTMLTASGVEAVVLEIREITPAKGDFAFRYRIRNRGTEEEGVGTMRAREATTQVCFDSRVCGWLLMENDNVRIATEPGPDGMLPVWSLEKQ